GLHKYALDAPVMRTYGEHFWDQDAAQWREFLYFDDKSIGYMGAKMPKNYNLVIDIDHEMESELTGIDYSLLEKEPADNLDNSRYGYLEMYLMNRDYPEVFPIIQREDLSIPLHLSLTVEELDVDLAEYKEN